MSQQINLILPELRPRHDWLAFPSVVGMAAFGLAIMAIAAGWGYFRVQTLTAAQVQLDGETKGLQQQVQSLSQLIASRKGNPALQDEIDSLKDMLQQRDAILAVVEAGKLNPGAGYAEVMRGFARQTMDGLWLTEFSLSGNDAKIRGRLSDPSLLPLYIRRLNGESVFQGRRFAALNMSAGLSGTAEAAPRYTEFVLTSDPVNQESKKP
ncbi:MAG TPA: PilN domain-containing protein [Rhodocyclaceae bacterium]|nr:PilN domain-containing protein [Rhodocyclaceae bacterium]